MSSLYHDSLIKSALRAVLAGSSLAETAVADSQLVIQKSNFRDIVTETDLQISQLIIDRLAETGLPVISEEEIAKFDEYSVYWAVDPIDGTVNFSHGLSNFAISVGLVENNNFSLGVVCAPKLDEIYFTINNRKALMNGRPFMHTHRTVTEALVASSFSNNAITLDYEIYRSVNDSTRGCLRTGSAALNICWAAAGKMQAAYGFSAKLWDVAGALAIASAAGCEVRVDQTNEPLTLDYIVGSKLVVNHITQLIKDKKGFINK